MTDTEKKIEEILSEDDYHAHTMGCFYQNELRQHDCVLRSEIDRLTKRVAELEELFEDYKARHY